jgi:hypothetical protein
MHMTTCQRSGPIPGFATVPELHPAPLRVPDLASRIGLPVAPPRRERCADLDLFPLPGVIDARSFRGEGVLCVHFSADGREHGMWFIGGTDEGVEAAIPGAHSAALPSGLSACWQVGPSTLARAEVSRGPNVLCDALLLLEQLESCDPGETRAPARQERSALRAEGLTAQQASLLAQTRRRPLLATVARRVELPAPTARLVHRILMAALCDQTTRQLQNAI